ncbi:MAG: hypothetical protein ACRC8M_01730 [Cetobacterium sp.]|uniref:hypothetical protein n=1 Tax=Cetobacterium sp. TaxID=2071632 RepID=UPI003F3DEBC2
MLEFGYKLHTFLNIIINKYMFIVLLAFLAIIYFLIKFYRNTQAEKRYIYVISLIIIVPLTVVIILKNIEVYLPGDMIGSFDGWLSFLGGYIGALLTLSGVWWQIKENNLKEDSKKNADQSEALCSFFILISNFSDNIKEMSEMYLRNYLKDGSVTIFDESLYDYNKELFFQVVSKIDLKFYKYAIKISNLFSQINLKKTKINSDEVCLETFFCEQLEVYSILLDGIESILEDYKSLSNDSILEKLDKIEQDIEKVQESYQSYFDLSSKEKIKSILSKCSSEDE